MKRYLILFIALWFSVMALPSLSQGGEELSKGKGEGIQEETKMLGLAIGLRSNYVLLDHSRRPIVGNLIALDEYQEYLPMSPWIQVNLTKYFALEFGLDQFKAQALNSDYHYFASDGDIAWTSYMLGLQFRWPHFYKSFVPYIVGGVSYNKNTFLKHNWYYYGFPDPETYDNWIRQGNNPEDYPNNGYRRIHSVEDSYGVFLGLGVDYFLTKHWAINIDYRYHWTQANWTYRLINYDGLLRNEPGTVVLDSWILGLGVKCFF
jgi:outer membrane protein W